MNLSVLRTQLSGVMRRPARLFMTGLSVLVAAFVVFATVLAYQIVTRTTLDTFSETPVGVSLVVSSTGGASLTARQTDQIRRTPGVAQVAGRTTFSLTTGVTTSGQPLDVIADPGAGPLSRIAVVTGSYPAHERQIALDRRAAGRLGAGPGSTLLLRNGAEGAAAVKVTVTGVVDGPQGEAERAYAPGLVVAGLASSPGYPRLDILAEPGTDLSALMTTLSDQLSDDPQTFVNVTTGETTRVAEARAAVRQFDQIFALVAMFVAIAVVAAALVATSTFRIVFAQRLSQLALLRTIGAQRRQLIVALAVEGAVVGLITGATGVLLALTVGLAAPAVAGAAGHPLSDPDVPIGAALAVVIGAALLTTGAVLTPAFSAADVPPLQALRSAGTVASERGISLGRTLLGGLLATAAAGLAWLTLGAMTGREGSSTVLLYLVGLGALAFGVLIAFGPLLIRPVLVAVGWPLRALGPVGRLAVGGVGGAPRRAAAVSVVVALGVTLVTGTVVGTASLQTWTDHKLAALSPADFAMVAGDGKDTADFVTRLTADPHFRDVTPFSTGDFTTSGPISYGAISLDMSALPALAKLPAAEGTLRALVPGKAILARTLARDLGVEVGDTASLQAKKGGTIRVEVEAILTDDAPLRMGAVLAPADLAKFGDTSAGVLANIANGTRDEALAAFRKAAESSDGEVLVLADERDKANGEVSSLLAAALGLLGLTVLISVIGVGTTTALSVVERTRESGLLRALGMSRPALLLMIGTEAGLYGVIGAVLGTVLGVPFAWLALSALRLDLPLTIPAGGLTLIAATLILITGATGLLSARKAARTSPIAALGNE